MIFPNRCLGCEAWLDEKREVQLCSSCSAPLHFLPTPGFFQHLKKQYFDEAFSCLAYEGKVLEWIHQYKYHRQLYFARLFGVFLCQKNVEWEEYDFLVPVPLHWWRHLLRGFNPSHFLAHALGKKVGASILPCLKKVKWTRPQAKLDKAGRLENVQGAFRLVSKERPKIKDKRLLLVDDVVTTGATANECAKVLKQTGAKKIDVLTLARAL